MSTHRDKRRVPPILIVTLLVIVAVAAYLAFARGPAPVITFAPALPAVGPTTDVVIQISEPSRGLSSFRVLASQGEEFELAAEEHEPRPEWALWQNPTGSRQVTVQVGAVHQPKLQEGTLTLRVETSSAGTWLLPGKTVSQSLELPVQLRPPALQLVSERPVVRQGGSGAVAYKVGEKAVRHGVRVGSFEVSGYALPTTVPTTAGNAAATASKPTFFALYGVPHNLTDSSEIVLFAEDVLGNRAERSFLSRFDPRRFTTDDIRLSDGFLQDVVPEIVDNSPEVSGTGDLLQDYLAVNGGLRKTNAQHLSQLSADSIAERLWQGPFAQLPSSRVMAIYGDHRTYLYNGEAVDEQTHLGHDLASVRQAPVPAAESGRVVMARYFGIYGNTVVLDHGYGLLTLYSHLSAISVTEGERVSKGHTLGRTGATGLAGGDHLHFTVVIGGVMVEPLEWWDRRWLESRIEAPLGSAFAIRD